MVLVTKADGSKQDFSKSKIIHTILKMGLDIHTANEIADKIERKIFNGVHTKKILQMIFSEAQAHRPEYKNRIDLRDAISLLRPKPDFEIFILQILKENGYDVSPAQLIEGKCVEHEIDGIARKGSEAVYLEVKHHLNPHIFTGLDVALNTWATYMDLIQGNEAGKNRYKFNKALIAVNTKFSDHAIQYAVCKGLSLLGWKYPAENGLEKMIEDGKLYPITFLKSLDRETEEKLGDNGIVMIKQLLEKDAREISRNARISDKKLNKLIENSKEILGK